MARDHQTSSHVCFIAEGEAVVAVVYFRVEKPDFDGAGAADMAKGFEVVGGKVGRHFFEELERETEKSCGGGHDVV